MEDRGAIMKIMPTLLPPKRYYFNVAIFLSVSLSATLNKLLLVGANERCEPCGSNGLCACCTHDYTANLPEIDCQGRNLMDIPITPGLDGDSGHFFDNLSLSLARRKYTDFNAERNRIHKIRKNDFTEFPDLRIIRLNYNNVRYIEAGSFATTIFLDELDLSHNQLGSGGTTLTSQTFDGLRFLKKLVLSYNYLQNLADLFVDMPFLEEIYMDHNPGLLSVAESSFKHSSFLNFLDLSVTQIGSNRGFKASELLADLSTVNLKVLNISYGHWGRSLPDLTNVSNSLEILDLSGNPVESADFQKALGLAKFTNLRQLILTDLPLLESLPPNLMSSMLNLVTLIISNCPRLELIGYQNLEIWKADPLYRVEQMVVKNTSIQTLENNSLPFRFSKHIDLSLNPWRCDCDLKWILDLTDIPNEVAIDMRCHSPENLAGALIMTLHETNLTCQVEQIPSHKSLKTAKILISLTIFLVIAFSIYTGAVLFKRISLRLRKPSFSHPLIEEASSNEKDPFLTFGEDGAKNSPESVKN